MKRTFYGAWPLAFLMMACHARDSGDRSTGPIKPIDVRPPIGETVAAQHCGSGGWGCEPIQLDKPFAAGRLVRTVAGGRVSLELDAATTLEIGADAQVLVAQDHTVEVRRGSVAVRELGGAEPARSKGARLRLGGHTAEVDAKFGGDFSVRAKDADHGVLTVERGRMTVQGSGGDTTIVLSGETVEVASGQSPQRIASPLVLARSVPRRWDDTLPRTQLPAAPRGLGTMTARVPGRTDVVSGVVLASHHVQVALRDGFARTEVEEVFRNDTAQVLEGHYVFPLPTDASISRLTLWVGDKPVEGEVVEKNGPPRSSTASSRTRFVRAIRRCSSGSLAEISR